MEKPSTSLSYKAVALMASFALMLSMVPAAWADENPTGIIAGTVASGTADAEASTASHSEPTADPSAQAQPASAKAAEGSSTGGTTVSIAVYRSSFPIVDWVLKAPDDLDKDHSPTWDNRPSDLPSSASPGQPCKTPAGYTGAMEPTREGYLFAGWSLDPSAPKGQRLNALVMPEGAPESGSYTLYALWIPEIYSIIFDLSKNPAKDEGPLSETAFELNWPELAATDRKVEALGGGCFRVSGFTVKDSVYDEDYDPDTGLITLPKPARSGYRLLGWAEPAGQGVARDAANGSFGLNLARLAQIDGTPVLTARWTSAFGVTTPLSITFGDYDKTGAPGNPWLGDADETAADDATQSEADDTAKGDQEGYEALGQAYFENTSWHEAVRLVGLASARHASASQVLTTYDSSKASEAQVLGDDTEANPGERLLSLYPSASAPTDDKSSGIHFRLTDSLDEAALGDAFAMAPQGEEGAKRAISYGLNLSTDPVDGSANHGLVLPTNDYERTQIATVSYTFATAKSANADPLSECFYIQDGSSIYDLDYIKQAANDLASHSNDPTLSPYYSQFKKWLDNQATTDARPGAGPYFKLRVDGVYHDVQLLGICQDTLTTPVDGRTVAGLTFGFKEIYAYGAYTSNAANRIPFDSRMNLTNTSAGGWGSTHLRALLQNTFLPSLDELMQDAIAPVNKYHQTHKDDAIDPITGTTLQKTTNETIWVPSAFEVFGGTFTQGNITESETGIPGYAPFQYQAFAGNNGTSPNAKATKLFDGETAETRVWWTRSGHWNNPTYFCVIGLHGDYSYGGLAAQGVIPCFAL